MLLSDLKKIITDYPDFPKKGIIFKDIMPLLTDHKIFSEIINYISNLTLITNADAIIGIDARGFIFGSCVSLITKKPFITARKPGKLPGELITKSYDLEYGTNELSIQKESLKNFHKYAIVDDLLATGGTVNCVKEILYNQKKIITGLSVVIELADLKGRKNFDFPVNSIIKY